MAAIKGSLSLEKELLMGKHILLRLIYVICKLRNPNNNQSMSTQTLRQVDFPRFRFIAASLLAISLTLFSLSSQAELSGLDHERDLNYAEAVVQYRAEIEQQEISRGEYDLNLFPRLIGLARSLQKLGEYEAATDAAQRAQHISHRHMGVHNTMQLEVLDLITRIHLRQAEPLKADKQQKFAYYVRKSNVEPDSLELLPAIEELSKWYEQTGQLHRARKLNEQSIAIVEAHFGQDTVEQLPYLQKLARLKRLQRVCCSTKIMKQALEVVDANPEIDDQLKADTYIEIADAYTISGDKQDAQDFYRRAWDLMPEVEREEMFSEPSKIAFSRPINNHSSNSTRIYRADREAFASREFRQLMEHERLELDSLPPQEFVMTTEDSEYDIRIRDRMIAGDIDREPAIRTVGQPYAFLHKQLLQILPSRFRNDASVAQLRVELEFEVDETGRPRNVQVISSAAPDKVNSLMKQVVRKSRFRPRIKDGSPVATQQFRLTQSFAAKASNATESI